METVKIISKNTEMVEISAEYFYKGRSYVVKDRSGEGSLRLFAGSMKVISRDEFDFLRRVYPGLTIYELKKPEIRKVEVKREITQPEVKQPEPRVQPESIQVEKSKPIEVKKIKPIKVEKLKKENKIKEGDKLEISKKSTEKKNVGLGL